MVFVLLMACGLLPSPGSEPLDVTPEVEPTLASAPSEVGQVSPPTPVPASSAKPEALLLGLRDVDGKLSTLFIDESTITVLGRGLAVPRSTGWWTLDVRHQATRNGKLSVDKVLAHRAGKMVRMSLLDKYKGCSEANASATVLFVSSDWYSVEETGGGYCGGAHPYAYQRLATYPIGDRGEPSGAPIDHVLGKGAFAAHRRSGQAAQSADDCLESPRPSNWGLIRKHGNWAVRGALSHDNEACRGSFKAFDIDMATTKPVTGQFPLPKSWSSYQSTYKGLRDVVVGPGRRLEVHLDGTGVHIIRDGKPFASHATSGQAAVMTHWVTGKHIERWRRESRASLPK